MAMNPGLYYIGDLCYVLDSQWMDVCEAMSSGGNVLNGECKLKNGTNFAIYGTAHGDGVYYDKEGKKYPVDSGTIGCIPFSAMDTEMQYQEKVNDFGRVVQFDTSFRTGVTRDGIIWFDTIEIQT